MAQILKYKEGGSTTPKWGTFTIDNVTYEMNDENIAALYNHAKQLDNDVQYQFGFIINALKDGQNLSYANNVLSGNINWDVSEGQNKKIHKRVGRGLGKGRDARLAISSLDDLKLKNPEPEARTLKFQDRYVEYEKGEDGKFVLDDGKKKYIHGPHNQEIVDFLLNIQNYSLSDTPFTIEGLDKDESWIRNWYKEYSNEFTNILGRIQTGESTAADKEILNDFLIYLDEAPAPTTAATSGSAHDGSASDPLRTPGKYTGGQNFGIRPGVSEDYSETTLTVNSPELIQWLNSWGKGVWLNDEFIKAYPEMASLLEGFPNGIFYIDGKFYDANDTQLLQNEKFKQFVEDNKKQPGSNKIFIQTFSNPQEGWRFFNTFGNKSYYSDFRNRIVRDLTGQYNLQPFSIENDIVVTPKYLFQIYPTNITADMYDQFGRIKPEHLSYGIIDDRGTWAEYNLPWERYLNELSRTTDEQRTKYYDTIPDFLYDAVTKGQTTIINRRNGIIEIRRGDTVRYGVIEALGNGKQRLLALKESWYPGCGINPLHKNENGEYDQVEKRQDSGEYWVLNLERYNIKFKTGGSIPKGDGGLKLPWEFDISKDRLPWDKSPLDLSITSPTPSLEIKSYRSPGMDDNVEYIITDDEDQYYKEYFHEGKRHRYVPRWYLTLNNTDGRHDEILSEDIASQLAPESPTTPVTPETPGGQDNSYGTVDTSGNSIIPSEIAGLARLAINLQSSAKSRKIAKEFADSARRNILAMQAPQKSSPKYVEPAENRLIDKQIADTLNKKYAYSDPVLIERMRDKDMATANYLNTQKSANSSQAFNQHRLAVQQINDENTAARIELNNNVLQSLNGIDQMEMNSELASSNTAATSWANYLTELQDKFTKFEEKYQEAMLAQNNLGTIKQYEADLEQAFKAAGGAAKLSGESLALYNTYGFRPAMLREIDPSTYEHLTRKFQLQTAIDRVNYGRSGLLSIYPELPKATRAKHGAKLSKLTTQMILNQGKKNVDINQLNKEITKIFLKLIK